MRSFGKVSDAQRAQRRQQRDGLPKRERTVVLGIFMAGATAACISQSMMIAALPSIMHEFVVDASLGQLITTAYIFTLGIISAMTAYLMNRVNSKVLFLASMACFTVGCFASLIAPNFPLLLASRLLQAGGAGISLPLVQLVALHVYPKSEYGRAMGFVGVIIGFAPAIGPTISGFMIDWWGWRSVFVALGAVGAAVMALAVPFVRDVVQRPEESPALDVLSAVLFVAGLVCVMAGVTVLEGAGSFSAPACVPIAAGILALAAFAVRQLRIPNPLLKLACFGDRTFAASTIIVVLSQVAFMSASVMIPLFVQDIQGRSAAVSGLVLLPGAVLLGFLNPVTGRLLDRHGPWPVTIAGSVLVVAGTVAFALIPADVHEWVVTALYGVRVVGVACLMMPLTAHACTTLETEDLAQGTAIITSLRQIFAGLVSSVLITVMSAASSNELGVDLYGFDVSFMAQAGLLAVGFAVGMAMMPRKARG